MRGGSRERGMGSKLVGMGWGQGRERVGFVCVNTRLCDGVMVWMVR